ncbi:MAG: creatininase family protein [Candidatus Micrarchaeota archaeon]
MQYASLSWEEAEKASKKDLVVILPVGAVEAHGRHLPLDVDSLIPGELAKEVADKTGALVLPTFHYGHCFSLREYAGTLSLSPETLSQSVYEICSELLRNGFSKILILNGHGGNYSPLKYALERLDSEGEDFQACIVEWWSVKELSEITTDLGHADENEASLYIHYCPTDLVKRAKQESRKSYFGSPIPQPDDVFGPSGYRGKVESISKEKGKRMAEIVVSKLVKLVESGLVLEEQNVKS